MAHVVESLLWEAFLFGFRFAFEDFGGLDWFTCLGGHSLGLI
jgi:hypothetical protein